VGRSHEEGREAAEEERRAGGSQAVDPAGAQAVQAGVREGYSPRAMGHSRGAGEACRNWVVAVCRNSAAGVGSPEGGCRRAGRMGCLDALGAGSLPS